MRRYCTSVALAMLVIGVLVFSCAGVSTAGERSAGTKHANPGHHVFSLVVNGTERDYIVYVPDGYRPGTTMPVVVMFHGGGGTARNAMRQTGWPGKADREGFLAVFPVYDKDGAKGVAYGPGMEQSEVVLYIIERHGHIWPGGENHLPQSLVGVSSGSIKATDLIWDFFRKHSLKSEVYRVSPNNN